MAADRRADIVRLVVVVIGTALFTGCLVILVFANPEYGIRSTLMLTGSLGAWLAYRNFRDVGRSGRTSSINAPEHARRAITALGQRIQRYW